ncbi:MAG: TrmB family transcriptional regulator [Spirochaetaceae bacterium]|nr:MAG: TrmB family transcriptional regulator [Spirochaetaceae bacterium]
MVVNSIIKHLLSLGISDYEARAYVAALSLSMATPYELARESGIPSSKIYEVISKLADRKLLFETEDSGKKKYVPESWPEFLAREESKFTNSMESLKKSFPVLAKSEEISFIYNIHDLDQLVDKSLRSIRDARESILLSTWNDELEIMKPELEKAQARGVRIAVVHFGQPAITIGTVFVHPIEDTLYSERGGRGFTLVSDSKSAIVATLFPDSGVEGAWSTNRGFVLLAEDYIKHDIYIMKIVSRFDGNLIAMFGKNYAMLRDIFTDKETRRNR